MENIVSGIYEIRNIVSGNRYIGSSKNIQHRWQGHLLALNENRHHSQYLQRSWNKYGQECFVFEVIEQCPPDKATLLEREQYYIDELKPEYNISKVAGSPLGVKRSDETKKKLSERHTGKAWSQERKDAVRATKIRNGTNTKSQEWKDAQSIRSRNVSEETRRKRSLALTGRKMSLESIEKTRSKNLGIRRTPEQIANLVAHSGMRGKKGYWTGAVFSEERLKKMSDSHLGQHHTEETKEKMRLAAAKRTPERLLEIANNKRAGWKRRKELKELQRLQEQQDE